MRRGVMAVVAALTLALVDMAAAQTIMWCHDASGKPVMTNQAGAAGLKCPTEAKPAESKDPYRVSPRCEEQLLTADRLVRDAWRDYGNKKELGPYLSAECRAEIHAVDAERTKNQRRGK